MLQTHLQNGADMVVSQRIEYIFAVPVAFDQMHLLQDPQLVGNSALGEGDGFRDIAHTALLLLQQRQDLHSGGVAEGLKQLRDPHGDLLFQSDSSFVRFSYFTAK